MKREKEVPKSLLVWLKKQKVQTKDPNFQKRNVLMTLPVRAVKMRILEDLENDGFHTVIIPSVDVYAVGKATLKKGFLKRDALSYYIAGTSRPFPYGHIYVNSGFVCLGNIFVPSAVPEYAPTMPLETLFLHNDRNLAHGDSHLMIDKIQAEAVNEIMKKYQIRLSGFAESVVSEPEIDIIRYDAIWCLSAKVVEQKSLPEALQIMAEVYGVVFRTKNEDKIK